MDGVNNPSTVIGQPPVWCKYSIGSWYLLSQMTKWEEPPEKRRAWGHAFFQGFYSASGFIFMMKSLQPMLTKPITCYNLGVPIFFLARQI
jgi:hypothetical protein